MKKTLKDIAEIVGVSTGTVSKVINNYSDVGQETREKVLKVLDEVGYQTNIKAEKDMIGLIYGVDVEFNHPFFTDVINSFGKEIGGFGYNLLFFTSSETTKGHKIDYLTRCIDANVAACIIIGGDVNPSYLYDLDHSEIPCIGIDIKLEGNRSGYLMTDNVSMGRQVVEHLYLLGHRKIGYIGGLQNTLTGKERTNCFIQAMTEFGLTINEKWLTYGDFSEESGYKMMNKLLSSNSELPTALFIASDMMAIGAITSIKEHGLKVPDDFAIIGCDDIDVSKYINQPLTTIKQDKQRIGKLAAYMIKDITKGIMFSSSILIDSELVIRQSCGALQQSNFDK